MVPYRKTVIIQDVKFVIESEKSNKFVDDWIARLQAPVECSEAQTNLTTPEVQTLSSLNCVSEPTKGERRK